MKQESVRFWCGRVYLLLHHTFNLISSIRVEMYLFSSDRHICVYLGWLQANILHRLPKSSTNQLEADFTFYAPRQWKKLPENLRSTETDWKHYCSHQFNIKVKNLDFFQVLAFNVFQIYISTFLFVSCLIYLTFFGSNVILLCNFQAKHFGWLFV